MSTQVVLRISKNVPSCNSMSILNNITLAYAQFGQPMSKDMLLDAEIFYDVIKNGRIKLSKNYTTLKL